MSERESASDSEEFAPEPKAYAGLLARASEYAALGRERFGRYLLRCECGRPLYESTLSGARIGVTHPAPEDDEYHCLVGKSLVGPLGCI